MEGKKTPFYYDLLTPNRAREVDAIVERINELGYYRTELECEVANIELEIAETTEINLRMYYDKNLGKYTMEKIDKEMRGLEYRLHQILD